MDLVVIPLDGYERQFSSRLVTYDRKGPSKFVRLYLSEFD